MMPSSALVTPFVKVSPRYLLQTWNTCSLSKWEHISKEKVTIWLENYERIYWHCYESLWQHDCQLTRSCWIFKLSLRGTKITSLHLSKYCLYTTTPTLHLNCLILFDSDLVWHLSCLTLILFDYDLVWHWSCLTLILFDTVKTFFLTWDNCYRLWKKPREVSMMHCVLYVTLWKIQGLYMVEGLQKSRVHLL